MVSDQTFFETTMTEPTSSYCVEFSLSLCVYSTDGELFGWLMTVSTFGGIFSLDGLGLTGEHAVVRFGSRDDFVFLFVMDSLLMRGSWRVGERPSVC